MLKFIGTGDLGNATLGNTSAYIKQGKNLLLLDCGTTAYARMQQLNIFEDINKVYIAITHMHPDHVGALANTIFYLNYWKNIVPSIIISNNEESTQKDELERFLSLQGVETDNYQFVFVSELDMPEIISFDFKPVEHSSNMKSYAFEIGFENKKIYYLGDNNDKKYIKSLIKNLKKDDLIYTDCTTLKLKKQVHMPLEVLNQLADESIRKQIYCMHFCSDDDIEEIKKAGYSIARNEQSKQEYLKIIKSR